MTNWLPRKRNAVITAKDASAHLLTYVHTCIRILVRICMQTVKIWLNVSLYICMYIYRCGMQAVATFNCWQRS